MLHDKYNSTVKIEHPENIKAAGLNNVNVSNIKECTSLKMDEEQ